MPSETSQEPLYTFVKGRGWVASIKPFIASYAAQDDSGRLVTILDRAPGLGERGWYAPPYKTLEQLWHEVTDYDFHRGGYGWDVSEDDIEECARNPKRVAVTVIY